MGDGEVESLETQQDLESISPKKEELPLKQPGAEADAFTSLEIEEDLESLFPKKEELSVKRPLFQGGEAEASTSYYDPLDPYSDDCGWSCYKDDSKGDEALKIPFVGDKEIERADEKALQSFDDFAPFSPTILPRKEPSLKRLLFKEAETEASNSNIDRGLIPLPPFTSKVYDLSYFNDKEILQQQAAIQAEEAVKIPFVGDKEPLSSLAAEYESGSLILQEKIKLLDEQFAALRRTRGDGNCFFRSFMFSYLEHILEKQDKAEVDRITANVEQSKDSLQSLGYSDFTFEDFFATFMELLANVSQGKETSISHESLLTRSRDQIISDSVVMFFRFVTSGEIRKRTEFFEPFILGLANTTVDQFCKASVEPMGEESDHVHITALSDALGVPIRVMYLDQSALDSGSLKVNHHDFIPSTESSESETGNLAKPVVTLLYRPGHYDILYYK